MLAQLRQGYEVVTGKGADVAGVFMGPPDAAGDFCRERELPFHCLADPDRDAYRAFGLARAGPRGLLLTKGVVGRGLRLAGRGVIPKPPGRGQDVRQLPGTFVISQEGVVLYAHYNADPSDDPDLGEVLAAIP